MKLKNRKKQTAARKLRRKGLSTREISERLRIGRTTAKVWVRDVKLSPEQAMRLGLIPKPRAKNCAGCGKKIPKKKDRRQIFCSRSCAAIRNNSLSPKRIRRVNVCSCCGKPKSKDSKLCQQCRWQTALEIRNARPIRDFFRGEKYAAIKFVEIRRYARQALECQGREKNCEKCGFAVYVEACHLRPITDFPSDTPLGVVNALNNLKYLCPNHHAMLDNGLLLKIVKD